MIKLVGFIAFMTLVLIWDVVNLVAYIRNNKKDRD